jgi:hypothetical protein
MNAVKVVCAIIGVIACPVLVLLVFAVLHDAANYAEDMKRWSSDLQVHGPGVALFQKQIGHLPPLRPKPDSGEFPRSYMTDLLPYIDQAPLYNQWDFKQSWDSPVNLPPTKQVVRTYALGGISEKHDAQGRALAHFAGNSQVIRYDAPLSPSDFTDGQSNTVFAGFVSSGFKPWADPGNLRDFAQGLGGGPDQFGLRADGKMVVVMADGSTRTLSADIDPAVLRAMASPNDGR